MGSLRATASDGRVCLEEILNTADPTIKRYFAQVYFEEVEKAEKRAVFRVADRFKHMLPDSQQLLVAEAMQSMNLPVARMAM